MKTLWLVPSIHSNEDGLRYSRHDLVMTEALLSAEPGIDDLQSSTANISATCMHTAAHSLFLQYLLSCFNVGKTADHYPPPGTWYSWGSYHTNPCADMQKQHPEWSSRLSFHSQQLCTLLEGLLLLKNELGKNQHLHCTAAETFDRIREDRLIYTGMQWENWS